MSRLVALALAALAVLPGVSAAEPYAGTARTLVDGVMVVAYDNPTKPTAGIVATRVRYYDSRGIDMHLLCLTYATRTVSENGCVSLAPGPVTDGVVIPTGATMRARVPVSKRRGGWMEIDLTATATGMPVRVPAYHHRALWRQTVMPGVEAYDGAQVLAGPSFARLATPAGTFRTDRGLRFSPVPYPGSYFPPMVYRVDVLTVTAHADLKTIETTFARAAADVLRF